MNKYQYFSREATKLRRFMHMCGSKKAFETEEAARCGKDKIYHCPHCNKFHRSGAFSRLVARVQGRIKT